MGKYSPLQPGDPVTKISRGAYNDMLQMLRWWEGKRAMQPGQTIRHQRVTTEVLVRNDSGSTAPVFGILGIDSPVIVPNEDRKFTTHARPSFACVEPDPDVHQGKWVALMEPVKSGTGESLGRAVLVGWALVRVYVNDTDHTCCQVIDSETVSGETVYLGTSASGTQMLWLEPTAEAESIGWAIVNVGSGGGGMSICKCQAKGAITGTGTKTVDNVTVVQGTSPLDDPSDTAEELSVSNPLAFDFDDNAILFIHYNETAEVWEIYQGECPA